MRTGFVGSARWRGASALLASGKNRSQLQKLIVGTLRFAHPTNKTGGNPMPLLQNHIAGVTGAASGIGRAIASGYAREGAQVVLLDLNGKAAEEAAQEIRDAGGLAESFVLDVAKREDCIAVARKIAEQVGEVSILVNNAGINRRNGITADADAVLKDWQDIMSINL